MCSGALKKGSADFGILGQSHARARGRQAVVGVDGLTGDSGRIKDSRRVLKDKINCSTDVNRRQR